MASMSYCVFENTATDMDSCVEKLQTLLETCGTMEEIKAKLGNDYEYRGLVSLIGSCKEFLYELESIESV